MSCTKVLVTEMHDPTTFHYDDGAIQINAGLISWDSNIFGFPVAQIDRLEIHRAEKLATALNALIAWQQAEDIRLLSVRLPHDQLSTSFMLEDRGFRFIEMVLHPYLDRLDMRDGLDETGLSVSMSTAEDLPVLVEAAADSFGNERFHIDPRISSSCADQRYAYFVEHAYDTADQELLVVREGSRPVAFFVTGQPAEQRRHWYLTAVLPAHRGRLGYGHRSWRAVLAYHRDEGIDRVDTTISARNSNVLGLYARLDFRFCAPEMTFHRIIT